MIALLLWASLATADVSDKVDLNHATQEQLMALPGIGEKKAAGIIEQRTKRPFKRTTEIMLVRGIGQKLYARIKDRLTLGPVDAPNLNTPAD